jgi:leucyl aminopeptidase
MSLSVVAVNEVTAGAARALFYKENGDFGENTDELKARRFEGKLGQISMLNRDQGITIVIGLGKAELDSTLIRKVGGYLTKGAWKIPAVAVELNELSDAANAQAFAEGVLLGSYQYSEYKTEKKPCELETVNVVGGNEAGIERGLRTAQATIFARDLINEPAATMTPRRLAEVAQNVAQTHGLDITVWDENDIEREGLGGLRGVSLGSAEPARLIQLRYNSPNAKQTIAIVGKGITFDSGGLSLKPSDGMLTMKTDMSGAAAVVATMSALADLKVDANVLGIMCCTENMPGGRAQKLGDVLRTRNGKTIEVANTDAEGRLVLADGLSIAAENKVDVIIDLATLTGAAIVALGREISCVMANNDTLRSAMERAGENAGEPSWPLPLPPEYRKHIESEIADMKNLGKPGEAGTIAGAMLLKEFVGDIPWAHLDIAGPARSEVDEGMFVKGATGVGVRTLLELLRQTVPT